ncbi:MULTISPECIES: hypothetical protein [unclassified Mesotoga]|uniref:hypothetical protein n=1 Tax=unclassified Mesotoga TaxID=1184398 RepID=UPI000DA6D580|nr:MULTISPECIES: hypothetical protein [unclassified Mesotoga]PZC52493.1 hypothetical protein LH53_04395 [Mesotoga sp. TolDC]
MRRIRRRVITAVLCWLPYLALGEPGSLILKTNALLHMFGPILVMIDEIQLNVKVKLVLLCLRQDVRDADESNYEISLENASDFGRQIQKVRSWKND